MEETQPPVDGLPAFLGRHPTAQYVLLGAMGVYGLYLAMPIAFDPQTTIEWVDLIINLIILAAGGVMAGVGGVLAVASGLTPAGLEPTSRPARFTRAVLRTIGFPQSVVPGVAMLGPLGLLVQIFFGSSEQESLPKPEEPEDESNPEA